MTLRMIRQTSCNSVYIIPLQYYISNHIHERIKIHSTQTISPHGKWFIPLSSSGLIPRWPARRMSSCIPTPVTHPTSPVNSASRPHIQVLRRFTLSNFLTGRCYACLIHHFNQRDWPLCTKVTSSGWQQKRLKVIVPTTQRYCTTACPPRWRLERQTRRTVGERIPRMHPDSLLP